MRPKSFLLFMSLLVSQASFAGFVVGNGGDALLCQTSPDNHLQGYYSLDYIVTLADKTGNDGLTPVASWNESSARIQQILELKAPTLAPYFKNFRELAFNKDYSKSKVWEPTPFGLVELDDQNITSLIPENCKKDGKTQLIQAVIREFQSFSGTGTGHLIYKYDPAIVDSLDKNSPLQLSFLMVHEWLWDLSQNVNRNRRINKFLHSREIETMAADLVIKNLQGMGLVIPDVQSDLFDEQICQGTPLTGQDLAAYYPRNSILANWGQISIAQRQRDIHCPAILKSCDLTWKKMSFPMFLLQDYKFFLSPSWDLGDRKSPLKIVSPEYLGSEGRHLNYGAGQFSCNFTEDPKQNIECKIVDSNFYYPVFGIHQDSLSRQNVPLLKGVLTTECFRLTGMGHLKIAGIGPDREHGDIVTEVETIFYLRAKGGLFLKPR